MSARKPNVRLLEQVYNTIRAERRRWNQEHWASARRKKNETEPSCKTAFCFAGHAVVQSGGKIYWEEAWDDNSKPIWVADECRLPHYGREEIPGAAARLLGLNGEQADRLFAGQNTMKDIRRVLDEIEASALPVAA